MVGQGFDMETHFAGRAFAVVFHRQHQCGGAAFHASDGGMEHGVNLFPLNPLFALHPFRLAAYFIHDQQAHQPCGGQCRNCRYCRGEVGKVILRVEPEAGREKSGKVNQNIEQRSGTGLYV